MILENIQKNIKNILIKIEKKIDSEGSEGMSGQKISNIELIKIRNNCISYKICFKKLQERLRKKENKEKFGNRILFSLFFSIVAVLFYITT